MKKIDLNEIIKKYNPSFFNKPLLLRRAIIFFLEKALHISEINELLFRLGDKDGIPLIDEVFEHFNFSFKISNKDMKKIPSEGRIICVANHPIGSLDGLALLKVISEIRKDVKIVANDILMQFENLNHHFLPINIESIKTQKENIAAIGKALENEEAVIIFPAGEVSRIKLFKIVDRQWSKSPIYFAKKYNSSILPIFVNARNSLFFYFISALNKKISRFFLSHEMFNKKNKVIELKIGDPIPTKPFVSKIMSEKSLVKLLRKHVYLIGRNKSGIFSIEKNILHPVDAKLVRKELNSSLVIGTTSDEKKIILTDYKTSPNVIMEIARLREVTFRKVGEGTGNSHDIDKYDKYYQHLVVWDEAELEIVGAYRIGEGSDIIDNYGPEGFYTSSLFKFSDELTDGYLKHSIELGRSFIQKKYWNTNALNYLWQGIGAYIANSPHVKFLFGAVSISNSYPDEAKQMILYFFRKWFSSGSVLASAKNPFKIPALNLVDYENQFKGKDYKQDYKTLKLMLKSFGFSVPILYKHYSELCTEDGVKFLDFCVDESFANCIDGLILVDVGKIKDEKRERFINKYIDRGVLEDQSA